MKKIVVVLMSALMCAGSFTLNGNARGQVTINLHANGGALAVDKITAYEGEKVSLAAADPHKDGMVFRGWAYSREEADRGELAFGAEDEVDAIRGRDLYAAYSYTVTLKPGPEGWGNAKTLYKYPDADLELCHSKSVIYSQYGMAPGKGTLSDQRVFIEWNTAYNSTTSRGTGTRYYEAYTENANATLYAIWGFKIFYNADGGVFPSTGTGLYKTYVANYDGSNYQNPKTLYGNFGFPDGQHGVPAPVKEGCTLAYIKNNGYAFLLLYSTDGPVDMNTRIFTTETASQNLTIPPTGGAMPWSSFHTTTDPNGDPAVEFYAAWQPSITYNANGGTGGRTDRLEIAYGNMYKYENYTFKSDKQAGVSRSGYQFLGWNTAPDGSGVSLPVGTVISQLLSSDSYTFYAQWKPEGAQPVTISYNANGGTNAPASQNGFTGEAVTLSSTVPQRIGFTFKGWGVSSDAAEASYQPGESYVFNSSVTLYAVWEEHVIHSFEVVTYIPETCEGNGYRFYQCSGCGYKYMETVPPAGHDWSEWSVVTEPTETETGLEARVCRRCGAREENEIPVVIPGVRWTLDGYDLLILNAASVDVVRLAPGIWTTSDEIRNAPGLLTYNSALIARNTDPEGNLRIDLLREGVYSIWVRYLSGKSFVVSEITVDPANITPYVSSISGITVKISDLTSDVKDIFIASGDLSTYRECSDNKIVRLTSTDLSDENQTSDYGRTVTYAIDYRNVSPDGDYTVCVRFNSGREAEFSHFHIDYPQPGVTVNGLQITVGGLQNIRNIRIAPGVYSTAGEVKRAEGVRVFSKNDKTLKNVADNGYVYTIQCRVDGPYTLSIEYIGGYAVVTTADVAHIVPDVTPNADGTVTFGSLEELYVIRYAPGLIVNQSDFKSAPGNRYIKPADISPDGTVTTPILTGVWSFMIQYREESYSILSVDLSDGSLSWIH